MSDSTASDWLKGPKRGWAQELPQPLQPGIVVADYADSGESTGSWLSNPRLFATVKPLIRPGDEVLIQLAHNDKTTPENTFRANLGKPVDGVHERGALPVLVTPPVRHQFGPNGKLTPTGLIVNNLGVDLPAVIRDLAGRLHVPLIDLTARSQALLEQLGETASWPLYLTVQHDGVQDYAHFSEYGGAVMAGLVTKGMAGGRTCSIPRTGCTRATTCSSNSASTTAIRTAHDTSARPSTRACSPRWPTRRRAEVPTRCC
ncbi:rhamnogalacturonan acetylesterase [Amycolatopsis mediterranei]|uniref:Rhamnogalacturan acetylesterase n=1 Tax=Amycolatopsis mediterranei (strain S699) TaxID=713604 RepID=A0A9R0NX23_AMYMS|nr:rhamnogalacturonan acetylesterase [Amycolatopsis mediterranei]AEK42227.1 rhamnogalacturan acetylesterase [Amycolatopsis mediterranei S699]UZF70669.1 rhamnogalacturonan acetylesterase [Amycolatopsis mediterranei]